MNSDRRQHPRFPVIKDFAEPVELVLVENDKPEQRLPAIVTDISAGGMALVVFAHVLGKARFRITFNIPELEGTQVNAEVAWTRQKEETTMVGLSFLHISKEATHKINRIAEAYQDCELKLSFGVKDACFHECTYWHFCSKPAKLKK